MKILLYVIAPLSAAAALSGCVVDEGYGRNPRYGDDQRYERRDSRYDRRDDERERMERRDPRSERGDEARERTERRDDSRY